MDMKIAHFIIGHHFDIMFQEIERKKFTSHIQYKAPYLVFGIIVCYTFNNLAVRRILLQQLQNGSGSPKRPFIIRSINLKGLIDIKCISLFS
ncbi:hypothetical protein D3C73_1283320 [compost metagenome]